MARKRWKRWRWWSRGGKFFRFVNDPAGRPVAIRAIADWLPDSLPPGVRDLLEEHRAARRGG